MLPYLLCGRVDLGTENVLLLTQDIEEGRLDGLAVTGAARSPVLPDLPTVAESGSPGFQVIGWLGVSAPASTPQAIVQKLNGNIEVE